jgi:hypothetical protein
MQVWVERKNRLQQHGRLIKKFPDSETKKPKATFRKEVAKKKVAFDDLPRKRQQPLIQHPSVSDFILSKNYKVR